MTSSDPFPDRVPLFPLPFVLFPGQVKQLRIFETRYRKMLQHCLSTELPFGIVLANPSEEYGPENLPQRIGTLAHIVQVALQEDDTYGIQLYGGERFVVSEFSYEEPYLQGIVEPHLMNDAMCDQAYVLYKAVSPLLEQYLQALTEASGFRFDLYSIPPEPEQLAYLAAITLQIDNNRKQALLAATDLPDLLREEAQMLVNELDLMAWINETIKTDLLRGFGTDNWLSTN